MKHTTPMITEALRALGDAELLYLAADRLEELQAALSEAIKQRDEARAEVNRFSKIADLMHIERDEARAEVERLKAELHDTIKSYKLSNLQPKTIRPEPSRLEIAAWLKAGWFANRDADFNAADHGWWVEQADKLIAAAREAK